MDFKGKKVLIFGVGRSGLAVARALSAWKTSLVLTDKRELGTLGAFALEAQALKIPLALGGHDLALLEGCSCIVISPGVPGNIEILAEARRRGIVILSEIELAFQLTRRRWLAVTGTNGKTTTTSLIAAMFEK